MFEAVAAARVPRLVYTSSVAAYCYHPHEGLLTEDTAAGGPDARALLDQVPYLRHALLRWALERCD